MIQFTDLEFLEPTVIVGLCFTKWARTRKKDLRLTRNKAEGNKEGVCVILLCYRMLQTYVRPSVNIVDRPTFLFQALFVRAERCG